MANLGCTAINQNAVVTIVQDYDNQNRNDFSAWGGCGGTTFCCLFDDDGVTPIDRVVINGTPGNDDFYFYESSTGDILEPHTASDLLGFMYGMAGGDNLNGSDYVGGDYRDNLYGGTGADTIYGGADKDWIDAGPGDDQVDGGTGNDRIVGGGGDDLLDGAGGHDVICDSSEESPGGACETPGAQRLTGNDGNDTIWYDGAIKCPFGVMDTASNAGSGTDTCGDTDWGAMALPLSCEDTTLASTPPECTDPN